MASYKVVQTILEEHGKRLDKLEKEVQALKDNVFSQQYFMNEKIIELILELAKNKETVINHPFEVGKQYFIRTVTYHLTGKLVEIKGKFLLFEQAAWIADSGRFTDSMKKGIDKQDS